MLVFENMPVIMIKLCTLKNLYYLQEKTKSNTAVKNVSQPVKSFVDFL